MPSYNHAPRPSYDYRNIGYGGAVIHTVTSKRKGVQPEQILRNFNSAAVEDRIHRAARRFAGLVEKEVKRLAPRSKSIRTGGDMARDTRLVGVNNNTYDIVCPAPALWRIQGFPGGLRPWLIQAGAWKSKEPVTVARVHEYQGMMVEAEREDIRQTRRGIDERNQARYQKRVQASTRYQQAKLRASQFHRLPREQRTVQNYERIGQEQSDAWVAYSRMRENPEPMEDRRNFVAQTAVREVTGKAIADQTGGLFDQGQVRIPVMQYGGYKVGHATLEDLMGGKFRYPPGYNFMAEATKQPSVVAGAERLARNFVRESLTGTGMGD